MPDRRRRSRIASRPPTDSAATRFLKVLVVGDSQGATLAQGPGIEGGQHGLTVQPHVLVWNRALLGCPISSRPTFVIDGRDEHNKCGGDGVWQRLWPADVAAFEPDVVVVAAGAWDLYDVDARRRTRRRPGRLDLGGRLRTGRREDVRGPAVDGRAGRGRRAAVLRREHEPGWRSRPLRTSGPGTHPGGQAGLDRGCASRRARRWRRSTTCSVPAARPTRRSAPTVRTTTARVPIGSRRR